MAKYIKEFKCKTRPQQDSNLKKVKEDILLKTYYVKEEKLYLKHLKAEYFQGLNNQNNQPVMINIIH